MQYPTSVSSGLQGPTCEGLLTSLHSAVAELQSVASKQQRELSRSLEPLVQTHMMDGYDVAYAESGTGSHRRRVSKLEEHPDRPTHTQPTHSTYQTKPFP